MRRYLRDDCCPANVFEDLYGANQLGRLCSRCSRCRANPGQLHKPVSVSEPRSPWHPPLTPSLVRLLGHDGRLLVTYDPDDLPRNASRRLAESFRRLQQAGVSKLLLLGEQPFDMKRVLEFAERVPFFVSKVSALVYSRQPKGPEIVMVTGKFVLEPVNLAPRPETPRIFIAPKDYLAPDGRRLRDVFASRILTLHELHAKVAE